MAIEIRATRTRLVKQSKWRLKSRLVKQSPPTRTKEFPYGQTLGGQLGRFKKDSRNKCQTSLNQFLTSVLEAPR